MMLQPVLGYRVRSSRLYSDTFPWSTVFTGFPSLELLLKKEAKQWRAWKLSKDSINSLHVSSMMTFISPVLQSYVRPPLVVMVFLLISVPVLIFKLVTDQLPELHPLDLLISLTNTQQLVRVGGEPGSLKVAPQSKVYHQGYLLQHP